MKSELMRVVGKGTFVAVAAVVAMSFATATDGSAKEYRLGTIVPAGHLWNKAAQSMGDKLEERSNGDITVSLFPSGQLGDESQMVQQLQTGALDMAFLTIADVSNRVPEFGALYAPFLVDNVSQANEILSGPTAQGLLELLPKQMGVVGVDYGIATMREMMSTEPMESIDDLKGKKMRITPFKPFRDFYTILGIAPTPMPLPDVYDALANGQVDAIDIDPELILNFKLYDRAPHLLLSNHAMFPMVGLVSGRVWAGMSEEDREMVRTAMRESLAELRQEYAEAEPQMIEDIRATGIEVKPVGPDFFPGVVEKWEEIWSDQKPTIDALREEAAQFQ
ncbi:TRAP transporter substrate-binding protein [Amorphus sp. MBR-141]